MSKSFFRHARLCAGLFVAALAGAAQAQIDPVSRACNLIGGRLQSVGVKTCISVGLSASEAVSVKGVPLLVRDYAPNQRSDGKAPKRVLMIGGIHGDELSSVSITFNWMKRLDSDSKQPFQWRVIPAANPDGLLARPSTRMNANKVDLNRNFPTKNWEAEATKYWKGKTKSDPRRFPGKAPLSEPETRWLDAQIRQFKPDAIVSIHAPYGVLDYDGPRDPPKKFGYLRLQLLGTYPGSLGNYAGSTLNVPVITLELPHAGIMPTAIQTQQIWKDMLAWLEKNLSKPVTKTAANTAKRKEKARETP